MSQQVFHARQRAQCACHATAGISWPGRDSRHVTAHQACHSTAGVSQHSSYLTAQQAYHSIARMLEPASHSTFLHASVAMVVPHSDASAAQQSRHKSQSDEESWRVGVRV